MTIGFSPVVNTYILEFKECSHLLPTSQLSLRFLSYRQIERDYRRNKKLDRVAQEGQFFALTLLERQTVEILLDREEERKENTEDGG